MNNKKCDNCDCIKSNTYGKLWIESEDFFNCPKIIESIKRISESGLVKKLQK